jgi:PAS domain S-box-containing protein
MDWQTGITLISIIAGSLSLGMGFLLWQYRTLPSAKPLMAASLSIALAALLYTVEVQAGGDIDRLMVWNRFKYLGIVFIEVFTLMFALDFAGWTILRVRYTLLLILPVITLFYAFINFSGGFWVSAILGESNLFPYLRVQPGSWYLIFLAYQTLVLLAAAIILFRKDRSLLHRALVVVAFAAPLVTRYFTLTVPLAFDLTPFMYMVMLAVLVFGIMQIGVFDVLPDAYNTVINNNPDGVLVVDTRNRVLATNPMFERLTGIASHIIIGNNLFGVFPRLRQWMPNIETLRVGVAEALDGNRHIEMRIIPLFDGNNFKGRAFIFRDITDRKQAEAALRESETRYRTLFDQAQDAIIVEDHKLNIIDANTATTRLLGYQHTELLHMTSDIIQPETFRYDTPDVKSGRFEMQAMRKDGSRLDVEMTIAPIPDNDKLLYMSIMRDITERKRTQQELKNRADELAALYETVSLLEQYKTDMIRMAAHDLRHPISVTLGYVELMSQMDENLTEAQQKYVKSIKTAVNRANKMLSDILSLERIEQQALQGLKDQFNFHMILGEIIAQYRDQAHEKKQRLIIDVDQDDTPYDINGDISQMTEAVGNLIQNAIKYTQEGGEIIIRLSNNGNQLIFEVRDNGFGIPKEMQERLFRPFYRAKTSETSHIEGTGLGLHLVKNIIERHGGSVLFRSVYGEGSLFGFRLPLYRQGGYVPPQANARATSSQTLEVVRPIYPTVD